MDNKKVGFYCQLPKRTIRDIKAAASASNKAQWQIVSAAVSYLPGLYFCKATRKGGPVHYSGPGKRLSDRLTGELNRMPELRTGGPRRKARGAK